MMDTLPRPVSRVALRDYQEEAVRSTVALWERGALDVLAVIPMGGGKTTVDLELIHRQLDRSIPVAAGERALWLVHTEELIQQPYQRMLEMHPEWAGEVGVVKAERNDVGKRLVFATVQTLRHPKRLRLLLKAGAFKILVVDEAHHCTAASYGVVIDALRAVNPALRHAGLTATPKRADQDGLKKRYGAVALSRTIVDMIRAGWMCPFGAKRVETSISIAGVRTVAGDFEQKALARVIDVDNCHELVVRTHRLHGGDRPTICFTPSVDGARRLAERFRAAGYAAAWVSGETPRDERRRILADFRAGRLRVLTNCQVLTEGLDIPSIEVVHWLRPTKSDGLYQQGIGRALRPYPEGGKTEALIFDYVPLEDRELITAGDLLGEPLEVRRARRAAARAGTTVDELTVSRARGVLGDEVHVRTLDLLRTAKHDWHHASDLATLSLGPNAAGAERILAITRQADVDGMHRLHQLSKTGARRSAGASLFSGARRVIRSFWSAPNDSPTSTVIPVLRNGVGPGTSSRPRPPRRASWSRSWATSPSSSPRSTPSGRVTPIA